KRLRYNEGWLDPHPKYPDDIPPEKSIDVVFECGGLYRNVTKPESATAPPRWEASQTCNLRVDLQVTDLKAQARAAEEAARVLRVPVDKLHQKVQELLAYEQSLQEQIDSLQKAGK